MSVRRALATATSSRVRSIPTASTASPLPPRASFATSSQILAKSPKKRVEEVPLVPMTDPLIASLKNATDTELIDAILAPPRAAPSSPKSRFGPRPKPMYNGRRYVSPYDLDWKSSIDPGFAFLTLRKRSSYGRFLNYIRPRLAVVYEALRTSGMNQLFASDVLIQANNHGVVRELLQLDAQGPKRLRSSLTVSLYEHIRKDLMDGLLRPLSGKTNASVAQALIAEAKIDLLEEIWDKMESTLEWSTANSWPFLQVMSCLTHNKRVDKALRYLLRLVDDQIIPKTLIYGNSDPNHSEAKTLLVQSTIVRLLLKNQMYDRVSGAADDILATMERSAIAPYLHDLIFEVFRTNLLGQKKDQVTWAGDFILRYARLPSAPSLPRSTIDTFLNMAPPHVGARWYLSLPDEHEPPSALHITRLAHLRPGMEMMNPLLKDLGKLAEAEFVGQRGHFLSALIRARHRTAVASLYDLWQASLPLTPNLVVPMVRLFTETLASAREHDGLIKGMVENYSRRSSSTAPDSPIQPLVLVHIHLIRLAALGGVDRQVFDPVARLKEHRDSPEIRRYVDDVLKEYPAEGFALVTFLREQAGFEYVLPAQTLIDACLSGDWNALEELEQYSRIGKTGERGSSDTSPVSGFQNRLVRVLRQIKTDSFRAVLHDLSKLHAGEEKISVRIYRRILLRAVSLKDWNLALQAWLQAHNQYKDIDSVQAVRNLGKTLLSEVRAVIQRGSRDDAERLIEVTQGPQWVGFGGKLQAMRVEDAKWDPEAIKAEQSSRTAVQRLWDLTASVIAEGPKEPKEEETKVAAHG